MQAWLRKSFFFIILVLTLICVPRLAGCIAPGAHAEALALVSRAQENAGPLPIPVQANDSGCFALALAVIGGMGEPPLASEPNCEGGLYQPGTVVTLTAQPAEGFHVYRWQGTDADASTEITNRVVMNADRTVGVHYVNDRDPHETLVGGTPGGMVDEVQAYTGVLTGTITAAESGLPLANFEVCAYSYSEGSYYCTQSGPDGVYAFTALPTGNYGVWTGSEDRVEKYYDEKQHLQSADHIQVMDGQTTSGIDIVLEAYRTGTISGRVTSSSGEPLNGVQVLSGYKAKTFTTCTDANGEYVLDVSYEDGDGYLFVVVSVDPACPNSLPAYAPDFWTYESLDIFLTPESPDATGIDFTLEIGSSISGTITSFESSLPLAGIPVCAETDYAPKTCAFSGADGNYTIDGLAGDNRRYKVSVLADGWALEYYNHRHKDNNITLISLATGQHISGINFALDPGGSISGTVTNPEGEPLGNTILGIASNDYFSMQVTTDANGYYSVSSIPYEQWFFIFVNLYRPFPIQLYAPQFWDRKPWQGDYIELTSETPALTGIDFPLEPLGAISGTVGWWNGDPIVDSIVCAEGEVTDLIHCVWTDSLGRYKVNIPYDYYWVVSGSSDYYNDPTTPGTQDQVVVNNGEFISGIDFIEEDNLKASDGTYAGHVEVTWSGVWGVESYELFRKVPGGSAYLVGSSELPWYSDISAIPTIQYEYQVRTCSQGQCSPMSSTDSGWRSAAAPVGFGDYDDSSGAVYYEGSWVVEDGTRHVSATPGDIAVFFFEGRCASVHFTAGKQQGMLEIYIDDELVSTLNQYIPGPGMALQTAPLCVEEGVHTLRLVNVGEGTTNIDAISVVEPVEYEYHLYAPLFP